MKPLERTRVAPNNRIHRLKITIGSAPAIAAAALCCLGMTADASAAGLTSHVLAGKMAIDKVQSPALRDFLHNNETNFLNGTMFPDAILNTLQQQKNPDADEISHGRKQSNCETPRGIPARFLAKFWQECPQGPTSSAACVQNFAYFMGIITHLVTDSPWHNQFINQSTRHRCVAGGPPSIGRDPDGDVNGSAENGRHAVADFDFDYCYAGAVQGRKEDVAALRSADATTANREGAYGGCPSGQFPNATFGGCYSCSGGYSHNPTFTVDTKGVCFKGLSFQTASRQGSYGFCPSGQFPDAGLKGCYSCPGGYSHNPLLTVDTKGVCFQLGYKLQCSLVPSPPAGAAKSVAPLQNSQNLRTSLSAALAADGANVSSEMVGGTLEVFRLAYGVQQNSLVASGGATPAGPVCGWIIQNGVSGSGALADCASESAKFLDALWNSLGDKGAVSVIRISTYEYAIVKGGQVLHRNWKRLGCSQPDNGGCSATNDQCIADDCHQAVTDCRSGTLPERVNLHISDGTSSHKRMLSVPEDGSRIDLYPVDDASGRQRWRLQRRTDGTYNILIEGGTRAGRVYLSTNADGSRVDLFTGDDGSGRQRWNIVPSGNGPSYLISVAGGVANRDRKYLSTASDASVVDLYSHDDASGRQRWTLQAR